MVKYDTSSRNILKFRTVIPDRMPCSGCRINYDLSSQFSNQCHTACFCSPVAFCICMTDQMRVMCTSRYMSATACTACSLCWRACICPVDSSCRGKTCLNLTYIIRPVNLTIGSMHLCSPGIHFSGVVVPLYCSLRFLLLCCISIYNWRIHACFYHHFRCQCLNGCCNRRFRGCVYSKCCFDLRG